MTTDVASIHSGWDALVLGSLLPAASVALQFSLKLQQTCTLLIWVQLLHLQQYPRVTIQREKKTPKLLNAAYYTFYVSLFLWGWGRQTSLTAGVFSFHCDVTCDNIKRPDKENVIVTPPTTTKVGVGVALISEHVSRLTRILARSRLTAVASAKLGVFSQCVALQPRLEKCRLHHLTFKWAWQSQT